MSGNAYGGGQMDGPRAAYQRARVMSATPVGLVVLLYERLMADLKGAAIAIRVGDVETRANRLQNATDILFELLGALDEDAGGEVTQRLSALYHYMIVRIGEAGRTMEPQVLEELAGHVGSLASAWRAIGPESSDPLPSRPS